MSYNNTASNGKQSLTTNKPTVVLRNERIFKSPQPQIVHLHKNAIFMEHFNEDLPQAENKHKLFLFNVNR
jgi:hypothetical protein